MIVVHDFPVLIGIDHEMIKRTRETSREEEKRIELKKLKTG